MTDPNTSDSAQRGARGHDGGVLDVASRVLDRTRGQAIQAIDSSREVASDTAGRAIKAIKTNPLGIVVGGLAVGAIAGALLPRSQREKELLAPLGGQIADRAKSASDAAREAGKAEFGSLGLTKDAVRDQAKGLYEGILQALTTAGAAAAKSVHGPAD